MTKRLVLLFIGISISLNTYLLHVNADEIYYTNANGVQMTHEQYDFFGEMYFDGYQEYVTQSEFNRFLTNGYFDSEIEKVEYDESIAGTPANLNPSYETQGLIHETTAKRLTLAKACGSWYCGIVVTLQWKGTPRIKSYDVIGALLYNNLTLVDDPTTFLTYSGGNLFYGDEYYVGGGFGTSVKLQNSSTNMYIAQSYDVYGTGTVYASYQHARKNITKTTSQKYTVGFGGYGGVFHFYGSAVDVFDEMGGVDVYVSI